MSLIEGIGDEVTILVTVIVAVTTVVAAWFSTSVTEQQPYWQDEPAGPGSSVDPEPPSQQSATNSEDGLGEAIAEAADTHERLASGSFSEGLPVSSETGTIPSSETDLGSENQAAIIKERVIASSSDNTENVLKNEACGYEEGPKQNTASQNSSFECIEATNNVSESSTLKTSADCPCFDNTDGVSIYEKPPSDIVEERVEDVQIHSEEQSVRRRHIPSTASDRSDSQTAHDQTDQSQPPSPTETDRDNQSEKISNDNVRRENQPQLTRDQAASGVITIKLRFLDETERVVSTNMADTLGNFRRDMFSSEMQSGQIVRLISNGQLLSEESRTLSSYGINNQQVIHCQISQASAHSQQGHQTVETGDGEFDLGRYMVPLFACILAFMWYLRFQYRYMFNATSTLSLTAVTAVFLLALMAVWRT